MKTPLSILIVVLGLFAAGCGAPVNCSEVAGKYEAKGAKLVDSIDLRTDGTYVHTCYLQPDGPAATYTNTWTCKQDGEETRITFAGFIWGADFLSPNQTPTERMTPSYWDVQVERSSKSLRLRIHPDMRWWYDKKASPSPPTN